MPPKRGAVLLAAALALAGCSPAKSPDAGPDLSLYLQPAFRAAFGGDAPATHEVKRGADTLSIAYSPTQLADLGGGRMALISIGKPDDCEECGGAVAVHYLQQTNGEFHVLGQWLDLRPKTTIGAPPEAHVRTDLFGHPAVQIEVPDRIQGCETASASLFELGPDMPVARARDIVTARSNIAMGAVRVGVQVDDYANILPDVKDKHFTAHYRGTLPGDVPYAPGPDGIWTPQGGIKLPGCFS